MTSPSETAARGIPRRRGGPPERPALVIGTRPEAIKLLPVLRALEAAGLAPAVFVTGQHRELLDPILAELGIRATENLGVMDEDQSLAGLSARVLEGCRALLHSHRPDLLVVQGDTTSTAMAALAAFYDDIPVAHVEAGLRTHHARNPFPEEMNRRLVACLAEHHFAPTARARENLLREGVADERIRVVGNTVIDALVHARDRLIPSSRPSERVRELLDAETPIVLATAHRRESFGRDLAAICEGLARLARALPDRVRIVLPVHKNPNVEGEVRGRLSGLDNVFLTEPLSYLAFLRVMLAARLVVTDSGGLQEEAAFLGIPILVTRRTSERLEAIEAGVAELVGCDAERLAATAGRLLGDDDAYRSRARPTEVFGDGRAAERIVGALLGESG